MQYKVGGTLAKRTMHSVAIAWFSFKAESKIKKLYHLNVAFFMSM